MRTDVMEPLPYEHGPARLGNVIACTVGEVSPRGSTHADFRCPGCTAHRIVRTLTTPLLLGIDLETGEDSVPLYQLTRRRLVATDSPMLVHFDREMARRWPELVADP